MWKCADCGHEEAERWLVCPECSTDGEKIGELVAEIVALPDEAYSDLSTVVLLTEMPVLRRCLLLAESARYRHLEVPEL